MYNFYTSFAVVLLSAVLVLSGCETSKEKLLIGKWEYASWSMAGQDVDINNLGNPVLEFKEGGVYLLKVGFQENTASWRLDKDTLVFVEKDRPDQKHLIKKITNDTVLLDGIGGDWESELVLIKVND